MPFITELIRRRGRWRVPAGMPAGLRCVRARWVALIAAAMPRNFTVRLCATYEAAECYRG